MHTARFLSQYHNVATEIYPNSENFSFYIRTAAAAIDVSVSKITTHYKVVGAVQIREHIDYDDDDDDVFHLIFNAN